MYLNVERNDPSRKGQKASAEILFGTRERFALYAVHTRALQVQFFVKDRETFDDYTGELGLIVAQDDDWKYAALPWDAKNELGNLRIRPFNGRWDA